MTLVGPGSNLCVESLESAEPLTRHWTVTATARLLVAGLAERGQDATGYAYHAADGQVAVGRTRSR